MIKKSILIIDDDIILLKTAEEILSDLYSVSVAKGGKQGIALLKKEIIPNLILLDIAMPEMDGYMTLEKIKGIPGCEEVPVIFLTGFSESDYEVKGLKAGATDYCQRGSSCESRDASCKKCAKFTKDCYRYANSGKQKENTGKTNTS